MIGRPRRALIPATLPGYERLPKYLVQEFHGLPNGNFSKRITRGYITGFDRIMLGRMRRARKHIVAKLQSCTSVLDVGCGGGQTAGLLNAVGVRDVWGVDSSPYLLQHAARAYPHVRFVHGLAEDLQFADARFDGLVACFVLHEMPPQAVNRALKEFYRVLKPGGRLLLCEPSAEQMQLATGSLIKNHGLAGLYFRLLAKRVHEPFVAAWHKQDIVCLLRSIGFVVSKDESAMPVRHLSAVKPA
jgi:ubiquinone/menaquinone biosynthesis C-methylase UbiE